MSTGFSTTAPIRWFAATAAIVTCSVASIPQASAADEARRLISAHGHTIEAFVFGQGPETLIMAAGNGRPASQLTDLAKAVASAGIRTVVYNYRGIGASDGPLDGLTLVDYGNDVWAIADALGVQKVHLAGKTYGNRVMRAASQTKPGRVVTIILVGAGGEVQPSPETIALYKRYTDPATPKSEWLSLQAQLMYAPGNEHLAEKDADEGAFPAIATAEVKASEATPKEAWSMGGTAPMLAITCLLDRVAVPPNAYKIAEMRPNTWLAGLPGCGHNMINEQPEELRRLIVGFIQARSSAKK
ncbi:alpha/beta hydrolase (plasmid) [Ensifer sp. PDNC004]|nr:alpha/beta hydrolase [Ensifer sp. PDNC004]QRY64847.1 alpha/beta hydrolase [Ensifer sp. PDNC004]